MGSSVDTVLKSILPFSITMEFVTFLHEGIGVLQVQTKTPEWDTEPV